MRSYPDTDIDPKRDTEDSETNLGPRRYLSRSIHILESRSISLKLREKPINLK